MASLLRHLLQILRCLVGAALLHIPFSVFAQLDTGIHRGKVISTYDVPGRTQAEICVIPTRIPWADYKSDDDKEEAGLCEINFHKASPADGMSGLTVGVCPKLHSTNPGIEIHELPEGWSKQDFERTYCPEVGKGGGRDVSEDNEADKLAKYKMSTSCSYTPALLSYYHLSRILGSLANVPPAVIRTMDRHYHQELADQAKEYLPRHYSDPDELIRVTWKEVVRRLDRPSEKYRKRLLTSDGEQSYGALQLNPRGEKKYSDSSNRDLNINGRKVFQNSRHFDWVLTARPLGELVKPEFSQANVQAVVLMKDMVDMLVMDYLLNQKDRWGNIHYRERYYFVDAKDDGELKVEDKKVSDKWKGRLTERLASGEAFVIREMLLKDNDCAVNRGVSDNDVREQGLLEGISHISPDLYARLLRLKSEINSTEMSEYFRNELLFEADDLSKFRDRLEELTSLLRKRCQSGELYQDLDLEDFFLAQGGTTPQC